MKYSIYKFMLFTFVLFLNGFVFAQTDGQKGIELYKKGDYQNAAKILKKAVKNTASDAQVWYYLGLSYLQQDKKKESENALEKAVEINGSDAKIRVGLAYIYLLRNKSKPAQAEAQTALGLNPNNAEAYYILSVVDFRNNQYSDAYEKAKQASNLSPDFAAAYQLMSESLISSLTFQPGVPTKKPEEKNIIFKEATESLEKYLRLSPNGEDTKFQREYLESLKFFSAYYANPENQIPVKIDTEDEPADGSKTRIKFLKKVPAAYTQRAREAVVSGTIQLLVGFEANGQIKHILIIKRLGYGLDEQAVRAARAIKFEPATKDGKPISTVAVVEYSFNIY